MEHLKIPEGYSSPLTIRETEVAIKEVKDHFERALAKSLHLTRVSAPLFVLPQSGMNDNLNGIERPVSFGIKEQDDACAEIVHSLAKWKRYALKKYGFHSGEGLYTDILQSVVTKIPITSTPFMSISGIGKRLFPKKNGIWKHWNTQSERYTVH